MIGARPGGAVILLLSIALATPAGEDANGDLSTAKPQPKSWWQRVTGPDEPANKDDGAGPEKKAREAIPAPEEAAAPAAEPGPQEVAMNAYWRRIQVADRLMEVALATNDTALLQEVEKLQQRIFQVYQRQTVGIPATGGEVADRGADAASQKAAVQRLLNQADRPARDEGASAQLKRRGR